MLSPKPLWGGPVATSRVPAGLAGFVVSLHLLGVPRPVRAPTSASRRARAAVRPQPHSRHRGPFCCCPWEGALWQEIAVPCAHRPPTGTASARGGATAESGWLAGSGRPSRRAAATAGGVGRLQLRAQSLHFQIESEHELITYFGRFIDQSVRRPRRSLCGGRSPDLGTGAGPAQTSGPHVAVTFRDTQSDN